MHILLICRHAHGSASFPAGLVEGHLAPERRYVIQDHQVVLQGHVPAVLHHDADELLAIPGELYKVPTPAEIDALAEAERVASMVQEDGPTKKTKASGG